MPIESSNLRERGTQIPMDLENIKDPSDLTRDYRREYNNAYIGFLNGGPISYAQLNGVKFELPKDFDSLDVQVAFQRYRKGFWPTVTLDMHSILHSLTSFSTIEENLQSIIVDRLLWWTIRGRDKEYCRVALIYHKMAEGLSKELATEYARLFGIWAYHHKDRTEAEDIRLKVLSAAHRVSIPEANEYVRLHEIVEENCKRASITLDGSRDYFENKEKRKAFDDFFERERTRGLSSAEILLHDDLFQKVWSDKAKSNEEIESMFAPEIIDRIKKEVSK